MRQPDVHPFPPRISRTPRPREGFALLITITLLAFLVLLLVSLASLTRVETEVASNGQKFSQARQHALFALNLAIGQLQRHAGPDRRVSAPANAGTAATNPGRSEDRPHWVGVWQDSAAPASPAAASPARPSPQLLTWLVSGNENPATPLAITPAAAPAAPPAGPASDTVWLVGDNSIIQETSGSLDKRIQLPKQDIKSANIPGIPGEQTVGRYAWWVGDEGVKARVNLAAADASRHAFSFTSSQRAAIGLVDRSQSTTVPLGSAYPAPTDSNFADLAKIGSLGQLPLVSSEAVVARDTSKARFHDLTAYSYSVLADAARGGLKKDLSAGLAAGAAEPAGADTIFSVENKALAAYGVPTWETLRSYAGIQVPRNGAATLQPLDAHQIVAAEGPRLGTGPAVIGPVMTYASLGFNYSVDPDNTHVNLNLFPSVVLWNPYTVTLPAADYTVGFTSGSASGNPSFISLRLRRWVEVANPAAPGGKEWKLAADQPGVDASKLNVEFTLRSDEGTFRADSASYTRFKISSGPIPPGQSLVFTLRAGTGLGTAHDPLNSTLVPAINPTESVVVPAFNAAGERVTLATPVTIPGKTATTDQFDIHQPAASTESAVFLTEFDNRPAGSAIGMLPDTSGPRWFQALLRVPRGKDTSGNSNPSPVPSNSPQIVRSRAALPTAAAVLGTELKPVPYWIEYLPTMPANPVSAYAFPLQWVAHGNPRAPAMVRLWLDRYAGAIHPAFTLRKTRHDGTVSQWPSFNYDPADPRASSGTYLDNNGTPENMTLWELPTAELGLVSLGQLQHAPLSSLGAYPAYAIGNSLTDFRVQRERRFSDDGSKSATDFGITNKVDRHYDLSWNLNDALWDRYFFSTVPSGQAPTATSLPRWTQADIDARAPLPNSRLHYYAQPRLDHLLQTAASDSDPFNQAAAHLLVAGGFNINSTSEQAWRAVLSGSMGIPYNPVTNGSGPPLAAAFPRFSAPTAQDGLAASDMWQGFRQLDENQIRELARNIVIEVKKRGPFVSLSDFVNRRLVKAGDTDAATGLKGALQAAIDASPSINPAANSVFQAHRVTATSQGNYILENLVNDDNTGTTAAHASRSAFIPKFLTQADVLTAIGPVIAARSDTFVVRAYGEALNPALAAGDPGRVSGQAWCEAVVQRLPDYVNPSADAAPVYPPADAGNRDFGRRFQIISFRWLTPAEI